MARLTPKQERFCEEIVKGTPQHEAYSMCYDVSPTTKRETIYRKAAEMFENGKITARIEELRKPIIDKLEITFEKLVRELEIAKEMCMTEDKKDFTNYIKAIQEQGKLAGLYVDKSDITSNGETVTMPSMTINGKKQTIKMGD